MLKRWVSGLLGLVFCPIIAFSQEIPQPVGWVNDFANVISQEYRGKLQTLIQELEEKTSSEIAVVTIDSIAPYDDKEYARLLFDRWQPGKKGKDNGVIVLVAIKERRWRIETGYGVEEILPDGLCGAIGRDYMVPYFKQRNFGAGLYYGVTEISKIIARHSDTKLDGLLKTGPIRTNDTISNIGQALFLFGFFLLWNIPWPIFIGLPFTLLFAAAFFSRSAAMVLALFPLAGYLGAIIIRYFIWKRIPLSKRKGFWRAVIFGLVALDGSASYHNGRGGFGGFRSGGYSGGGGGFGGGGGGGGGAGGGF